MKNKYSTELLDDLAKLYNFMVHFEFPMTAHYVWVASRQTTGIGGSPAYCEKFIKEIEDMKVIAETQPTTTLTIKELVMDKNENLVETGGDITTVIKTYSGAEMRSELYKINNYKFFRVKNTEKKHHENLDKPI